MSVVVTDGYWGGSSLIYSIIVLFALYLSFKRNGGFNLWSFAVALFAAPLYIVYFYGTENSGTTMQF